MLILHIIFVLLRGKAEAVLHPADPLKLCMIFRNFTAQWRIIRFLSITYEYIIIVNGFNEAYKWALVFRYYVEFVRRPDVCMYVCMHECMYVRTYVCMYVCMYVLCMFVCMNICITYVCMHECMYVRTYVCMYVLCMFVCMNICITYVCMYAWMYVCTYVCMYV